MSGKPVRIIVLALFLALVAAIVTTPGGWAHFKFTVGNFDRDGEMLDIQDTIRLFSATVAGFYVSGGNLTGLNMFPAEKMIKRMVILDIRVNAEKGRLLVLDRDRSEVRNVLFGGPTHAAAVLDETWFMQYQDAVTRRPLSGKKANVITVRYILKKMWSRWVVVEYEVYGRNDEIPPVQRERFARW